MATDANAATAATLSPDPSPGRLPAPPLADGLAEALPRLAGAGAGWLDDLRRDGLRRYMEEGPPGPRTEAWKYTGLRRALRADFAPLAPGATQAGSPAALPAAALGAGPVAVCVNGRFRPDLSQLEELPEGLHVAGLAETLHRDPDSLRGILGSGAGGGDGPEAAPETAPGTGPVSGSAAPPAGMPMLALNTAAMEDGVVVRADPGCVLQTPLHLVFAAAGDDGAPPAFHPRLLIVAGDGARLTVTESHSGGDAPYLANHAAEISVGAGAALTHCKLQREGATAVHLAATLVALGEGGRYENFTMQLGGLLARNEIHAGLGDGAECRLAGAYAGRGRQHIDNTTVIDHLRPDGVSTQVYRGALDGRSRGVFQGKIRVCRDAQKTDGHQINKALLLSPEAEIDSKPELEIYADDVKCGHGATAGEIDEDQLFYMVSRGIPEGEARDMLIAAFLGEAIAELSHPGLREAFTEAAASWFAARGSCANGGAPDGVNGDTSVSANGAAAADKGETGE